MGTGTPDPDITEVNCTHCGEVIRPDCAWRQGRCPHQSSLLDQILADFYLSRFYNLIKFFTGRR